MTSVTLIDEAAAVAPLEAPAPVAAAPSPRDAVTILDDRHATVRDSKGRLLKVRRLSAFDKVKLFRALGAIDSENRMVAQYAGIAASVIEIDGHAVTFPMSSVALDALLQRLDDHGLEAAANARFQLEVESDVAADAKK